MLIYSFLFEFRLSRWIDDEEEVLKNKGKTSLQYVILDFGGKFQQMYL
jgi:hypothetical protein